MASIKHLVDIDLNKNQLTNVKLQHLSGNPTASAELYEGRIFYDSDAKAIKFHNGTTFLALGTSSGDITGVTLAGDSGSAADDDGNVDLTIAGGNGITTSASSTTLTVALDASLTTVTSALNSSLVVGRDAHNQIKFSTDDQIIFRVGNADGVTFKASGEIEATSLDISGDVDVDGTLEADAITVGGTALNTVIAGVTVANATTAAVATTVTITDNENTSENNAIIFAAGADQDGGNLGLESDGNLLYTPSSGTVTATAFAGDLTGDVTGNASTATKLATARSFTTTGDVVVASTNFDGSGNFSAAATIQANAVEGSMLNNNAISGQTDIGADIESTDEILISDGGSLRRSDVSRLTTFLQSALTFTTNTDADVSVENLKTRLAGGFGSNAVTIGDSNDTVTIGNDLVVTGDLTVSGDTTTVNTATLSVEDPLIILASGNTGDAVDTGFYSKYVESSTTKYAGLFRDVSSDGNMFTFFDGLQAEPGTTVNTSGTGYDLADVQAGIIKAADGFVGNITGNVTGNVSGTAATVTGAAQSNITSLGTLTTLTVDDITINGSTISDGGDMLIDVNGDLSLDANGGDFKFLDDGTEFLRITNSSSDAIIRPVADAKDIIFQQRDGTEVARVEDNGTFNIADNKLAINGTAVTVTATELNLLGGLSTLSGSNTGDEPDAATDTKGIVELATTDEALAGSDSNRAVTPAGLAARSFRDEIGDGSTTGLTINHALGTRDVIVQLYDSSDYSTVVAQVVRTDANNVTATFNVAPGANSSATPPSIIALVTKID